MSRSRQSKTVPVTVSQIGGYWRVGYVLLLLALFKPPCFAVTIAQYSVQQLTLMTGVA